MNCSEVALVLAYLHFKVLMSRRIEIKKWVGRHLSSCIMGLLGSIRWVTVYCRKTFKSHPGTNLEAKPDPIACKQNQLFSFCFYQKNENAAIC